MKSRFGNPSTPTEAFPPSDVYFTLEGVVCLSLAERWQVIPDFTRYEASTAGRIRDKATGELLRLNFDGKQQYYRVSLKGDDGTSGPQFVHRMVAKAFSDLPLVKGDGWVIDHVNHNGEDNRPCNLRAISAYANASNQRYQVRYDYENQALTVPLVFAKRYGVRVSVGGVVLPAYRKVRRWLQKHPLAQALALLEASDMLPQLSHPEFVIA